MNSKMLIGLVIAALVLAGVMVAGSKKSAVTTEQPLQEEVLDEGANEEKGEDVIEQENEAREEDEAESGDEENEADEATVREVKVEGSPFKFVPAQIRVKQGDTVKVTFVNKESFHDFVLDEFDAKTKQLQAGSQETVTFVADKAGTFEYYCSVGNHRAQGMVGKLIVE